MADFLLWMLESSLLIGMILGIRKIFMGKIRYAGIYALWLVVLMRLFVPVHWISTPVSVGNIISNNISEQVSSAQEEPEPVSSSENLMGIYQQTAVKTETAWNADSLRGLSGEASQSEVADEVQRQADAGQETEEKRNNTFIRLLKKSDSARARTIFGIVWLCVSVFLLSWFVLSNVSLLRRLKKNRLLYGKRKGVNIYAVSGIQNPCLYGFFRPDIYLPKFLVYGEDGVRADGEEIEQMITHEYVHYCHRDYIWAMLRMLLVSIYWFHPFVWCAAACSKKDAELFCDETVIRLIGEEKRLDYGKMLVRLASDEKWCDFRYSMVGMSRRGREMERRIRAISVKKRYSKGVLIPLAVVVLAAAGITCSTGIKPVEGAAGNSVLFGRDAKDTASGRVGDKKEQIQRLSGQFFQLGVQSQLPLYSDFYVGPSSLSLYGESSLEKVFQNYISLFTEAVNTGNTGRLNQVLSSGSGVYTQQCNLVKNYYKRGIREEVKECFITSYETVTPKQVNINSDEKIMVYYGDKTKKLVKQKYRYTCEFINGGWLITEMEDTENK